MIGTCFSSDRLNPLRLDRDELEVTLMSKS